MTVEKEDPKDQVSKDQAAQAQGFEQGFGSGASPQVSAEAPKPEATPEPTAAPAAKSEAPQAQPKAVSPAVPEAAPAPIPKAEDPEWKTEIRKLHGQYGALSDLLKQALKTKEAEGKPAALTQVELKRMKAEFPDMAEHLQADIAEAIAGIQQPKADSLELDTLVSQRVSAHVAREAAAMRADIVTDAHPTWKADYWVGGELGKQQTPEATAWLKSLPADEAQAFKSSQNPAHVIRKLTQFYDWKNKAEADAQARSKVETEKQERLKNATTPAGVARAGTQTMSDDEAMRKGFELGFNA